MDWKLGLVVVPVANQDLAKKFYVDQLGWDLLVDVSLSSEFRVIQVVPPGSACAIALMKNVDAAGSVQGLHLTVDDIEAALLECRTRNVDASELFHFVSGERTEGPAPSRGDYETFFEFSDPDGTGWLVQEVREPAGE
jgi:catechol 2,3-dioxygenase-like lactoylglutathione lyase family enzyme